MKIINNMKISWEDNPYVFTKITGPSLDDIKNYCKENNLTIVESYVCGYKFVVQAEKPNNRFQILRKRVVEIPGYKLIEDIPTKKMHWLTYEKLPVAKN